MDGINAGDAAAKGVIPDGASLSEELHLFQQVARDQQSVKVRLHHH